MYLWGPSKDVGLAGLQLLLVAKATAGIPTISESSSSTAESRILPAEWERGEYLSQSLFQLSLGLISSTWSVGILTNTPEKG